MGYNNKRNEQAKSNANSIEHEIESLKRDHKEQSREFWAHVKEINGMFKTLKPLWREDRERLWAEFRSICEAAKRESRIQSKKNASLIEHEIESLKRDHKGQFGEFWAHVREINSMFKTLKPLSREDRERLWAKFDSICKAAKKEMETRRFQSKKKQELIESKIQEARYQAEGSWEWSQLSKAKEMLNEALQWMKDGWGGFNLATQIFEEMILLDEGKLLREDRDRCWEKWKRANEAIKYKRQEFYKINYDYFLKKAYDALSTADYHPREAKSMVKEIQQELRGTHMNKSQFQEVHKILNRTWEKASYRLKEAYQRKHKEWLERMQEHIERWSRLLEKNESVISRIEAQIDDCQDMERNARTPEFAAEVRGWIEEKYQRIEDIRETNRELEEKIRSVQSKIRN